VNNATQKKAKTLTKNIEKKRKKSCCCEKQKYIKQNQPKKFSKMKNKTRDKKEQKFRRTEIPWIYIYHPPKSIIIHKHSTNPPSNPYSRQTKHSHTFLPGSRYVFPTQLLCYTPHL
jgi:hypothetical protein